MDRDDCEQLDSTHQPTDGNKPIGAVAVAEAPPVSLSCSEVWGGNRTFFGPVELPGIRGTLFTQACDGARGGDIHYLSVCDSGMVTRLCVGDVAGHGQTISAVSSATLDLLRKSVNRIDERKVLRRLNLHLVKMGIESMTTAAVVTYLPLIRRFSVSYAGHEPVWYWSASSKEWELLWPASRSGITNIPLAVERNARFSRRMLRTSMGDRMILMTDGVLETPSPGGALFGRDGLRRRLVEMGDLGHRETASAIVDALRDHSGGGVLRHDDVTFMVIDFVDNLRDAALWSAIKNRWAGLWSNKPRPSPVAKRATDAE